MKERLIWNHRNAHTKQKNDYKNNKKMTTKITKKMTTKITKKNDYKNNKKNDYKNDSHFLVPIHLAHCIPIA